MTFQASCAVPDEYWGERYAALRDAENHAANLDCDTPEGEREFDRRLREAAVEVYNTRAFEKEVEPLDDSSGGGWGYGRWSWKRAGEIEERELREVMEEIEDAWESRTEIP